MAALSEAEARSHVATWSARLPNRQWWPQFVYHFTDVRNAAKILNNNVVYSRTEAISRGLMENDNASPSVIAGTSPAHKAYARFYFRPLTPTQYHNEGIRPPDSRYDGTAHCPVPVFLLFDFVTVATRPDACASAGNMGASSPLYGPCGDMFATNRIPFDKVFHLGPITQSEIPAVTNARHAELLVPTGLPIDGSLKGICCRSSAEMATLLHLLTPAARTRWGTFVRMSATPLLFQCDWFHVQTVGAQGDRLNVVLHRGKRASGKAPMRALLRRAGLSTIEYGKPTFEVDTSVGLILPSGVERGHLEIQLFGCLAYSGYHDLSPDPF